jgi:hypothetical protein
VAGSYEQGAGAKNSSGQPAVWETNRADQSIEHASLIFDSEIAPKKTSLEQEARNYENK